MLIPSETAPLLSPLSFLLNRSITTSTPHEVFLLPRAEQTGLSRPLLRRKKEMGRQRTLESLILIPEPSPSSFGYTLPGTVPILPFTVITAKAHGGSPSLPTQNFRGPMGSSFP